MLSGSDAQDLDLIRVELPARFMAADRQDRACVIRGLHDDTLEIHVEDCEADLHANGRMVVYADLVGRIEGHADWSAATIIHLAIDASRDKRRRLRLQFQTIANLSPDKRNELRAHRRIRPEEGNVALTLPSGRVITGEVKNFSRSGAALSATFSPGINEIVTIGSTRGKVVRYLDDGFAVQFFRMLPLERFSPTFRL